MAHDKELEIRLLFLEEAQEYLETLGLQLLGLAQAVEAERINEALRAAHSIKGGASLMGFQTLSDLAHRLEDGLKVLKVQRHSIEVDAALEQLLLQCVDCLGRVIEGDRAQTTLDPGWLTHQVEPLFQQLYDRLGEPQEEDARSLLSPEEGQDIIPLLFETEVEGCLERLEGALNQQDPRLREEVAILAQELAGLGEMLQLEAFIELCQAISQHIETASEPQIAAVAQAALQVWRRVQALVLTGNLASIPSEFNPVPEPEEVAIPIILSEFAPEAEAASAPAARSALDAAPGPEPAESRWVDPPTAPETLQENTVRVPVQQINQLSDLFGELTIERNRLDLEVKRLRDLVVGLQDRLRTLEQINADLRSAYDRVATQTASPSLQRPLLPAAKDTLAQPEPAIALLDQAVESQGLRDQFDVLELDRYRDMHLPFRETIETIVQLQEVGADIDLSLDHTEQTCRDLRKTTRQLQKNLTQLRMRPLTDVFDRFPRALRQMSLQYGKPVDLAIQGGRTLVDRNVLEALQEPLTHIIRNCFDHGIEEAAIRNAAGKPPKGLIEIRAFQQSNRTLITIRDDGGGIPIEKIRSKAHQMGLDEGLLAAASDRDLLSLIFEPGFSTAGQVTSLSGRGIGMDVVRNRLKEIRGDIQVDTQPGQGTIFTLSIPFTLSVIRVLIVESHGLRMAVPIDAIEEMFILEPEQVITTAGKQVFEWEDQIVQLVPLSRWLVFNCPVYLETPEVAPVISTPTVLLVQHHNRLVGIQIDRSWGEQEVANRRVEGNLPMPPGFNSCTILGDGQVVPLVNVSELLHWITSVEVSAEMTTGDSSAQEGLVFEEHRAFPAWPNPVYRLPEKPTILVIDDSINVRRLLALTLEKAGYLVTQAKDGQDALDKLTAGLTVKAVLCDVEMPRLDGYGFLAQLRSRPDFAALPVAMLTSRGSEKHRQLAANLGASAYFTKPYNEQFLLKTLADLIEPVAVSPLGALP